MRVDRTRESRRCAAALLLAGLSAAALARPLAATVRDEGRWQTLGPYEAAVGALAIDPADPANVYAGTSGGSVVWTSADGGATWSGDHQGLPGYGAASAIAIDPRHPSTIYLADAGRGAVWKSLDGGATWGATGFALAHPNFSNLWSLAIDPRHPRTLYVGSGEGVWKSVNSGATWAPARRGLPVSHDVFTLAIDPSAPRTLYAGVGSSGPGVNTVGVWKTTDGGATWAPAGAAPPAAPVLALAIDPHSPQVVYAASDDGLWKSADGGASWRRADHGLRRFGNIQALALDPASPGTLFAAAGGAVFKSLDGGASWAAANQGLGGFHVISLAVDSSGSGAVYAGTANDGLGSGVFKSSDGGASWSARDQGGLTTFAFSWIAESPQGTIYAAGIGPRYGTDLFVGGDGGLTWTTVSPRPTIEIAQLVIDSQAPATLYGVGFNGLQFTVLLRSRDGGASWTNVQPLVLNANFVAIDPQDDAILYVVLNQGLVRSADGGATWTPAAGADLPQTPLRQVVIDPVSPANVYAFGWGAGQLWKSADRGLSWTRIGNSQGGISALVVDPHASATLFAVAAGAVEKSADGGATWSVVYLPPDPVHAGVSALAIAPTAPSTVYAAVPELGVVRSTDGGATWDLLPAAGLGPFVQQLLVDTLDPHRLIAGIFQGGLQSLAVPAP